MKRFFALTLLGMLALAACAEEADSRGRFRARERSTFRNRTTVSGCSSCR